ncbi:MAG TPA: hypothetical protein VFU36_03675, partial [Jatrophihabitans sp.]|nr:hypothetical protein [Jatrophihabitans sp.]
MNDLDTRIRQALRAQAEQLTESGLTRTQPPGRPEPGWRLPILAAAAVVLLAAGGTVAIRAATGHGHRVPAPAASRPHPGSTAPSTVAPPVTGWNLLPPRPTATPSGSSSPARGLPAGYVPLWPIDETGHGQPAGDAPTTALAFTRQYLRFTEIDTVTSSRYDEQGAHIGVGYRNPAGRLATAAVLHLVQYPGSVVWEVVGSDDTTLTLEQPAYGSTVRSPVTIGGHITGVDENIHVMLRFRTGVDGDTAGVPAGGQNTPW